MATDKFTLPTNVGSDSMADVDIDLCDLYNRVDDAIGLPTYTTAERTALSAQNGWTVWDSDLSQAFYYKDGWIFLGDLTTAKGAESKAFRGTSLHTHNQALTVNHESSFYAYTNRKWGLRVHQDVLSTVSQVVTHYVLWQPGTGSFVLGDPYTVAATLLHYVRSASTSRSQFSTLEIYDYTGGDQDVRVCLATQASSAATLYHSDERGLLVVDMGSV